MTWLVFVMFFCTTADPNTESLPRERARERDRGRSHERKHHSSSAAERQQRYYSCDRYGSHEQGHSVSAGPSRATSPGEPHDPNRLKQVRWFLSVTLASKHAVLAVTHSFFSLLCFRELTLLKEVQSLIPQAPAHPAVGVDSSLRRLLLLGRLLPTRLPTPLRSSSTLPSLQGPAPLALVVACQSTMPYLAVTPTANLPCLSLVSALTPT